MAQGAAIEALQNASVVIFCVDIAKNDWSEDIAIRHLIEPKVLIPVATKSDLVSVKVLADQKVLLNELFGKEFLETSVKTGTGIEELRQAMDQKILEVSLRPGAQERGQEVVALTIRHRQTITEAIKNINEAIKEIRADNDEVAAMMVRAAYKDIGEIQQPTYERSDDQILERIFSRFCIGK